jgi:phosphoglycolate phosphatase
MTPEARLPLQAVLFDLDGTLLDTAPDMIGALNRLLAERGRNALSYDSLRCFVSHGSARLVRVGFADLDEAELPALQQRFLEIYSVHLSAGTTLFPGMQRVLDELRELKLEVAIVTNKPGWLTAPLLQQLRMDEAFACVVSGDTLPERKPHPWPLLHAAQVAGVDPARCVYVGDAERDIQAARGAGMTSLIARYGYIAADEAIDAWRADGTLNSPQELLPWLRANGHV